MLQAIFSKIRSSNFFKDYSSFIIITVFAALCLLIINNLALLLVYLSVIQADSMLSAAFMALTSPAVFYYVMTVAFILYAIAGIAMFLYWGNIGLRGLFYLIESIILYLVLMCILATVRLLKYGIIYSFGLGELYLSDSVSLYCSVQFDLLSLLGAIVVLILTAITLTFGIEYMSREAFAYSVVVTLAAFSSSIVWFIISINLGLMTIFWELSGTFSLMLVDTFYSRIRTTQAVSRTFVIGRLSDYFIFIGFGAFLNTFETDSIAAVISAISAVAAESTTLLTFLCESTEVHVIVFALFAAASCKCAQLILFVWLPDAMEAPTPASALIHSSTLVVMGIFMLLRVAPLYQSCSTLLYAAMLCGAVTILYGSVCSVQTGDLKKAVAYSTISQVGYLYCGCGLLALKETLLYLMVHAICKAMLFIFVGYVVHLFGGTTSLRKMGGVFFIIPDVACFMVVLCLILAGAPYTVGFLIKELIVARILSASSPIMCFVAFCWVVSFACTPLYLLRVCVLPIFGRPHASRKLFRGLLLLKNKSKQFSMRSFNLNKLNNPLVYFIYHARDFVVSSRATAFLHVAIMLSILYFGEFLIYTVIGLFGASGALFSAVPMNCGATFMLFNWISTSTALFNMQILVLVLFYSITAYFILAVRDASADSLLIITFFIVCILFVCLVCGAHTAILQLY